MDKNTFDQFNREYEDALKKVRHCVNSEGFKLEAAMMGARLLAATKKRKGASFNRLRCSKMHD